MLFFCVLFLVSFSYCSDVHVSENGANSYEQKAYLRVKVKKTEAFEAYLVQKLNIMAEVHAYYSTAPGALQGDEYVIEFDSRYEEYMSNRFLPTELVSSIEKIRQ
jgi:hypothetical protein